MTTTHVSLAGRIRKSPHTVLLVLAVSLLIIVARQILVNANGGLLIGADWRGPIYSLPAATARFTQTYHGIYFGTDFPFGWAELGLALLAKPNPIVVNFLLVLLPIPVSSITCYYFALRRIRNDSIFAAIAGLAYAVNPLTVSRIYTVEVLMLWVYALIPLFFMLALEYRKSRSALASAILLNVMLALRPQSLYIVGFIGIGLLFANVYPANNIRTILKRDSRKILKATVYFALTAVAFNGVYLGKILISTAANPTSLAEVTYLYSNASPQSIFRLVGEPSFYHSLFGYYDLLNPLTILGIITLLGFFAISLNGMGRDPKIRDWGLVFLFIFILLSIGHFSGTAWDEIMASSTITAGLRNPDKFLFAMALPFSIVFANGFDTLQRILPRTIRTLNLSPEYYTLRDTLSSAIRKLSIPRLGTLRRIFSSVRQRLRPPSLKTGTLSAAIVIALILLQNFPVVTTNLLAQQNQVSLRDSYWVDPSTWSRYNQVSQYITNYRTLVLPFTYEVETAVDSWLTGYQIVSVPPGETGAETGALTYWSTLLDSIANNQSDIAYNLKLGGIRYVVVDQNQSSTLNRSVALDATNLNYLTQLRGRIDNYLYMEPAELFNILNSQPYLRYLGNYSGLQLFENIEYSGKLFGAYLAYTSDQTIISDIPLLSNNAIPTSDQTLEKYATVTVFNATHPFDASTIQMDTPQILIFPAGSTNSQIRPTVISGNLGIANISLTYDSAQPGWKNIEVVSPYPLAVQPSGIDNYNLLYATGTGWVPTWNATGFNDIFLNNQIVPIAVYKSNTSGTGSRESYSAPLIAQPPQRFNYSSAPGIHKGFSLYTGTGSISLSLSFSLVLEKLEFVFNAVSFEANLAQDGPLDIVITPVDQCKIRTPTLQIQNAVYSGGVNNLSITFYNITLKAPSTFFTLSGAGISSCSDAVAWLIPTGVNQKLRQNVPVPSEMSETPSSLQASISYNGPAVLVLAYAYDPSWTIARENVTAHFNAFGMNSYVLDPPSPVLYFVFSKADLSSQMFTASRIATALLVAFLGLTEPASIRRVKTRLIWILKLIIQRFSSILETAKTLGGR
jgi:hypothetical protein